MINITEEDSKRITSLRFLLIIFPIFIHNNLNADYALNYQHLDFCEPAVITWFKHFVTSVLGSAAVPLFFLFAGYLQFCKNDNYKTLIKKRSKTLLVPYIAWTVLNVLLYLIGQSIPQVASFFRNENNFVRNWDFCDYLGLFWVHNESYPFVYQFWFLRDLMVLVVLSPVLNFLAKKASFLVLIGITLCYLNNLMLDFGTAIFFYMAGWFFANYKISFFKLADKIKWFEYAILMIFMLVVYIVFSEKINFHGLNTIISCFFFLKLSGTLIANEKLFKKVSYLSEFSFFVYAAHMPFLGTSLNKISWKIIPLHGAWCLIQFIAPVLLCVAIGTGIGILMKKFMSPVFKLLNGSR